MVKLLNSSYSVLVCVLSVLILLPLYKFNLLYYFFAPKLFQPISSVWCVKTTNSVNICKFKNICYNPLIRTYLFFLSEGTVIKGLNHYSDLQKIQLSSVNFHNKFYANISVIDMKNNKLHPLKHTDFNKFDNIDVISKSFSLSRFKPNNIMHVIHDDLFPLFLTLEYLCVNDKNCMNSYTLIINDGHSYGPYFELYKLFSSPLPLMVNNKAVNSKIICFEEMVMGLVQDGIFYQYGFNKPQGPIKNPSLSVSDFSRFTLFIKEKMRMTKSLPVAPDIVIFNRQKSRKILNILEVKNMIVSGYQKVHGKNNVNVFILDLNTNSIFHVIKVLSYCQLLVGMHGAEMILSIFLKPNATVIELFPFAIQPEIVSFVKPISELEGSYMAYFSWRNMYKNNSVGHPYAHPLYGGINHLDNQMQHLIKNTQILPAMVCCNNPIYLYHMYQDTWVTGEFKEFFLHSIVSHKTSTRYSQINSVVKKWFHPYAPYNISCKFHLTKQLLFVRWNPPFNVNLDNKLKYYIYLEDETKEVIKDFVTESLHLSVKVFEMHHSCPIFHLWISVWYEMNDSKSRDSYIKCFCIK